MKSKKCYRVNVGLIEDDGNEVGNYSSETVIAEDALQAIKKARLHRNEYAASVTLVAELTK